MMVKGDATLDGAVTIEDVALVELYVQGLTTLSEDAIMAADVTGDGVVDGFDRNKILQHIRGEQMITQVVQG